MKRIDLVVLVSAAAAAAAPVLLTLGLGSKTVRDSSLVLVALSCAAAIVALSGAWRRRGAVAWTLAVLSAAIATLFAFGATMLTGVPESGRVPRAGDVAPPFSLSAVAGKGETATLGSLLEDGPILLVFLRGVW